MSIKSAVKAASVLWVLAGTATAGDQPSAPRVVHRLESHNETLELTVNTSRILTIGKELPRVIVNNPEIAEVTALSPTQVQVMAKKPGVTQINLFATSEQAQAGGEEEDEIHTVDLIVYPDVRELSLLLRTQFPTAALKVVPTANSVIISGYVDDPSQVQRIVDIATDYAPKVLNNIKVGGVQQVLLQVKVMEVSRTKLRNMGFDWGNLGARGDFAVSGIGGLLNTAANQSSSAAGGAATALGQLQAGSGQNFTFGVLNGGNSFFGVLNLLTQKNVAKVVAEPQLVTVSGRPASFSVGGVFPIIVASAFYQSVQWRQYGTKVDFVPIVLGNGAIRLEVRPSVSELDPAQGTTVNGTTIPGLVIREVDTGAELRVGQTLALAGLVQQRVETQVRGLIGLSELPLLGIPFRNVHEQFNEVETLIMVTPQLVDAMDPCETPPGGPGYATTNPDDHELYCLGHIEVPNLKGPDALGPYPDPHAVFPPVSNEAWDDGKQKKDGKSASPATPIPPATGNQSRRSGSRPGAAEVFERPKPPSLGTGNTAKKNSAGFVRFDAQDTSSPNKPTVKRSASRPKKTPGFIGPTGYDLR
ncbi:MAG TPA: pilus assembly protein N-terminal domain-containing protein [Pirellulales bacterium]|nr:pilus assembly protein N-terminal domain-containing protein [Pirellulales bacterium]